MEENEYAEISYQLPFMCKNVFGNENHILFSEFVYLQVFL
jgi:hypothetical protein